jgi:hypothetical protein
MKNNHHQPTTQPKAVIDVSGEVPAAAITALLDACRSGAFGAVQQRVRLFFWR